MIQTAIDEWNSRTEIKLIPKRSFDKDWVAFEKASSGCQSHVGRIGGKQSISCNLNDFTAGSIMHEIGHAVGLHHEHQRSDSRAFVTVSDENDSNLKVLDQASTINVTAYDFGSIMHYPPGKITTIGVVPPGVTVGQRNGLSDLDIAGVNFIYNNRAKFFTARGDGMFSPRRDRGNGRWDADWSHMIPVRLRGSDADDLLFYNSSTGRALMSEMTDSFDLRDFGSHSWWRGWSSIVSGNFGGRGTSDIFLFNRSTRNGVFTSLHADGGFSTIEDFSPGSNEPAWDIVISGHFGGFDGMHDLFLYDRGTGRGVVRLSRKDGSTISLAPPIELPVRKHWDTIVRGHFSWDWDAGWHDLICYSRQDGEGMVFRGLGGGQMKEVRRFTGWRNDWDTIVTGKFTSTGAFDDLLFYSRTNGLAEIYNVEGYDNGKLAGPKAAHNWDRNWKWIIPAKFATGPFSSILCWNPAAP